MFEPHKGNGGGTVSIRLLQLLSSMSKGFMLSMNNIHNAQIYTMQGITTDTTQLEPE